jgi:hypothetical protein
MNVSINMNEHALRGQPLGGAVAGDGVAVVEVAMLCRVEFDLPAAFQPRGDTPIRRNGLDDGKIAVGNSKLLLRSRLTVGKAVAADHDGNQACNLRDRSRTEVLQGLKAGVKR